MQYKHNKFSWPLVDKTTMTLAQVLTAKAHFIRVAWSSKRHLFGEPTVPDQIRRVIEGIVVVLQY
jgi:hypothetical protein